MDKSKKQGLILGCLVVVMLAVYGRNLMPRSTAEESDTSDLVNHDQGANISVSTSMSPLVNPVSDEERIRIRKKQHERMESIVWSRDPFAAGSVNATLSGLLLSGIMWDPANPMAIINGQLVRVGDQVERYQIVTITQDEVSVSDGIETFKLNTAR